MRALVTGGTGFLGSALVEALQSRGCLVVVAEARCGASAQGSREAILFEELVAALSGQRIDVIFHLAGSGIPYLGRCDKQRQHEMNVRTAVTLARAVLVCGYRGRIVMSSSAAVYGNTGVHPVNEDGPLSPCSAYGTSKLEAECALRLALGVVCDLRIARLFHVFGPGQMKLVVYDLSRLLLESPELLEVRGTGDEVRDFIFVTDAVQALIALGFTVPQGPETEIVNVCSGEGMRIIELARRLSRIDGKMVKPVALGLWPGGNPVAACVGSNKRLTRLGVHIGPADDLQFRQTLDWVKARFA